MGANSGAKIKIASPVVIRQPTPNSSRLTSSMNISGLEI